MPGALRRNQEKATAESSERPVETLLTGQTRLLEMIARGRSLPAVLEGIARMVKDRARGAACCVFLVDDGGRLRCRAATGMPSACVAAIEGLTIGAEAGPEGAAAFLRQTVAVKEMAADPLCHGHREAALEHGLRACIAAPVLASTGAVLGVIALYYRQPRADPDPADALLRLGAQLASIAIERTRTQQLLKERAEQLAEMDRRRDEFLATLAHELRNPLAPIRNAMELLHYRGDDPQVVERARETVERQVRNLVRLVDDLLDVSRITRGKISLREGRLDLARLVNVSVEDHRPRIQAAGLSVTLETPDTPVWILGDPTRLAQLLDNLLGNATKFTEPGGSIYVRLAVEDSTAVLTVRDTGIGIEPALLPRLFQVFIQGDLSLDRTRGGLGLGLAIAKGLVDLHGGQIEAHSAGRGQGADFVVRLPVQPEMPALAPGTPKVVPAAKSRRVLVIEDNRDAADSLADLLRLFGYEVEVAYGGPQGLEAAIRFRPQVVLCDIGLPGLNGYHVARHLRQNVETAGACLIAVTGYGTDEDRKRVEEAGFDLHLVKPLDADELLRRIAASRSDGP